MCAVCPSLLTELVGREAAKGAAAPEPLLAYFSTYTDNCESGESFIYKYTFYLYTELRNAQAERMRAS